MKNEEKTAHSLASKMKAKQVTKQHTGARMNKAREETP